MAGSEVPVVLDELETAVLRACGRQEEWPAQVAAGVYAGVGFAIERPLVAAEIANGFAEDAGASHVYGRLIGRLAGFLRVNAPVGTRLPASTDEALVAGIVGLVGDHIRLERLDRLAELRPELVLLTLLPYLGFEEAQWWANRTAAQEP